MLERSYVYMVKNADAADVSAASVVAVGNLGADNYHILQYNQKRTFVGGDYQHLLNNKEVAVAKLSPAFWNIVTEINTPATHMYAHKKIRPFTDIDHDLSRTIQDDLWIHLKYVITATAAQRQTWYSTTLLPLVSSLAVGDLEGASDFLGAQTGAGLAAAFGIGTDAQWTQLLSHVSMMVVPHLEKFPR